MVYESQHFHKYVSIENHGIKFRLFLIHELMRANISRNHNTHNTYIHTCKSFRTTISTIWNFGEGRGRMLYCFSYDVLCRYGHALHMCMFSYFYKGISSTTSSFVYNSMIIYEITVKFVHDVSKVPSICFWLLSNRPERLLIS